MREFLRGYADAIIEEVATRQAPGRAGRTDLGTAGGGDLRALAGDVAAVAAVVEESEELLLVLTDPGIPAHVRRAVVADLFRDRVSSGALRLVLQAIEVGRPPDLLQDLDWLTQRTAAARDGRRATGPAVLGHHAALERLDGYARGVLESVDDRSELSEIEDALFRFERIVAGSVELTEALTGRDLPPEARAGLVADLLGTKAGLATTRLAAYAATVGRPRDYLALLEFLVARVAAEADRRIADVRAMTEMTDDQQQRLATALSHIVGQRIEVRVLVDPGVLGGFVASIGDTVVDGSIRHRLDLLKERLAVSEAPSIARERRADG